MEPIVYDTVMNANRTSHWPCHERFAEKRVMLKAAHSNHSSLHMSYNQSLQFILVFLYKLNFFNS